MTTTKENPIEVNPSNTITINTKTMIGPLKDRTQLPDKFQQHCPNEYDVRIAHSVEIGKEDSYGWANDEMEFLDEVDFFDNAAPSFISNHTRRKRSYTCKMFGEYVDESLCHEVVSAECAGNACSIANILYQCEDTNGRIKCNYLTIPCIAARAQGLQVTSNDQLYCMLHMANVNEHCTACCRDTGCNFGSWNKKKCPT